MIKTLLIILIVIANFAFSQSINNMTLLGNKNEFTTGGIPSGFHYSSTWGYTAPNGREYAILGHYAGTTFYDITDAPTAIRNCGTVPGLGSQYNYREFKTYSHYAYIVSEGGQGVQIVDLQYLPDSVHFIKSYTFGTYTRSHTISIEGKYLYCNGGNYNNGGVFILDLTDPVNPVKRGQWGTRYVHDCQVKNDTIFAACINDGYVAILDAKNKDSIKLIYQFTYPNPVTHNAWVTEDRKYLVTTDEEGGNHAKIWNIQNIFAPVQVADITPYELAMVHNAYIRGDSLYLAHYRAGVIIYNIANRSNPIEVGHYDTYPGTGTAYQGCWNVYPYFASKKIIAADIATGLYVLKLGTASNITPGIISNVAEKYSLSQNYPNPFNPETKIKFSIPENTFVMIKVYDLQGKIVADLVNGTYSQGSYEIKMDASKFNLSSGTYLYKIETKNFSETKKFTLLK
ncbi:MAG: choice-of-anchor B family protein [Ignavibacteria bacterium]|nr:choice-of-anchor B family protein [Ignavibacteria bacterium]